MFEGALESLQAPLSGLGFISSIGFVFALFKAFYRPLAPSLVEGYGLGIYTLCDIITSTPDCNLPCSLDLCAEEGHIVPRK